MAKKKNKVKLNKWVKIIMWIFGVLAVLYLIYLIWPFLFWSKYTDNTYGYRLMYPSNWHVSKQESEINSLVISADPNLSIQDPINDDNPGFFTLSILKRDNDRNIEKTIKYYQTPGIGYANLRLGKLSNHSSLRISFIQKKPFYDRTLIDFIEVLDVEVNEFYYNFNGSLACEWNCRINMKNFIHYLSIRRIIDSISFSISR